MRDLAEKARVGLTTVNRFENGIGESIPATIAVIQRAFEDAGVVFLKDGVVCPSKEEVDEFLRDEGVR